MSNINTLMQQSLILMKDALSIGKNIVTLGSPYRCGIWQFDNLDKYIYNINNFIQTYPNIDNDQDNNSIKQYYLLSLKRPLIDLISALQEIANINFTCGQTIRCLSLNKTKNEANLSYQLLFNIKDKLDKLIKKSYDYA